jgi:tetratricopeptide (TPR) repeat protein
MRHLVTTLACTALLTPPATTIAQQPIFLEGLSELTAALGGTLGNESAQIDAALDKMSRGLAAWDAAIRSFEARVAAALPGSAPGAAAELRATLGRMYAGRGRLAEASRELDAASRLEPRRADLHTLRGLVLETSGGSAEAGEAFRLAWALDESDPIKAYQLLRHPAAGSASERRRAHDALAAAYETLPKDAARATSAPFSAFELLPGGAAEGPVIPPAAWTPGYARLARGEYDLAMVEFRRAAENDPLFTDPAARSGSMNQAITALARGRLDEARARLAQLDVLTHSSEAHRVMGLAFWADSQFDRSVEALTVAVARNPGNERAHLALARVLSSAGRDAEAERALLETLRVIPGSAQARWWLGRRYEQLNRFAEGRLEFQRAEPAVVAGRSTFFVSIGRLASSAADAAGAVEALERAVRINPNSAMAHKLLGTAFLLEDRTDEAFAELVAAAVLDPRDPGAHTGIGRIHLNAGRYPAAVAALRRAIHLAPGYTEARYALGTALMRMGQAEDSARELERVSQDQRETLATRRRTMSLEVLKEEAALRLAEGNADRAVALWREVLDREPKQPSTHVGLAAALVKAGDTSTAIHHYEQALGLGAGPAVARELAALYTRVGRTEEAARARIVYEKSLQDAATAQGQAR